MRSTRTPPTARWSGSPPSASDADATTNAITYSLDNNAGGRFAINASTGVVTVAGAIDRETAASYNITVRATSADTSFSTQTFTIAVNDVDEFDVGTVTDGDAAANAVNENAANGTVVGITASASDADATTNAITYSLDNNAGGRFAINASTGVVTVAGAIDRETAASYNITVRATSADTSFSTQTFTIAINGLNDNDPVITSANAANVAENTTAVLTVTATDTDLPAQTLSFSISGGADAARFTINGNTGQLTFSAAPDYETPTDADANNVYVVQVTASDGAGRTASQTINVTVNDADEFDVGPVSDADATANAVAENALVGTAVGLTAAASDADATATITYSLDDDAGGRFAIHSTSGVVTVNAALDYETAASHSVTIRATSSDGSFSTRSFSIAVTNVNESAITAISDTDGAADLVLENAANGTAVRLTAFADDPDGTDTVSYWLDDDGGGRFAIDANTGLVTVVGAIDREVAGTYEITVRATSSDSTSTTRTFTIAIGDVDEFDITPISDSDVGADAVDENAAVGTAVGITALASDGDATTSGITYSLDDDAGGQFAIDPSTGVVTVAGAIDREAGATRSITVRATSDDGSTTTQGYTIAINDVDEFDITPISDGDATADAVDENAAVGTAVGITALASDADATTNGITYSLDDDAGGQFSIDPATGVVTVAGAIDREAGATRSLTIRATSDDGSTVTQNYTIAIHDLDEFDITPISDSDATEDAVDENAAVGTAVGITALTSDGDATTSGITYSLDDDAGGQFAVDPSTGVVTVAGAVDREAGATRSITIRATSDDGSTATQSYTIVINDLDEFDITPVSDSDAMADAVDENAAVGTAVGITALASDADATTSGITYSLDDDSGGQFAIDPATGVVTVAGAVDREARATRSITVRATSDDGSTTTQSYTIAIHDVDEFDITPISDANLAADAVDENAAVGTAVGITAHASDGDATTSGITYSLDDDAGSRFAIDPSTGVVTVAGAIDREAGATRSITIRATSDDGSTTTRSYTIAINDVDEFDITPISDSDATADAVDENAAVGTAVGITPLASDADATTNGITYSLDDDAGGQFAIDPSTGVVTVAGDIDREAGATRSITIRATSDDGSTLTQNYTIAIHDLDEFDITPINDSDVAADAVDENAALGAAVGITALASDGDATTNGITYSLDDDAGGQFAIDPLTGVVTVAGAIDREAGATRSITIRATSDDGSTVTQNYTIAIHDLDEFDITPISDSDATADAVDENAAVGTAVGITALASDADATTNGITYSLADDAGGQFAIDPSTGVVTVAGAIDREAGATRTITIRATSADGSTATQTYTITIRDLDEFDVSAVTDVDSGADQVAENSAPGTSVGIAAWAQDLDSTTNTIRYALDDTAHGRFAIDAVTGAVTTAAALDYEAAGSYTIAVRASSADGSFATQTFTIQVRDVNETPWAVGEQFSVTQAGSLIVAFPGLLANDFDVDGDGLTIVLVGTVSHGRLTLQPDGSFSYVPEPTYAGSDHFTYLVSDGNLRSETVTVTIAVEVVAAGDGGNGSDPGPDSQEPDDKDGLDEDLVAPADGSKSKDDGQPPVALPSSHHAGLPVEEVVPAPVEPQDSPAQAEDARRDYRAARGWFAAMSRQSASLQTSDQASPRTEARATDEPSEQFVAAMPLSVDFARADGALGEGLAMLSSEQLVLGATTVASTALSVGYVVWLIRCGSLVASMLASLPAWCSFDPLPILASRVREMDEEDDERLEDIVAAGNVPNSV